MEMSTKDSSNITFKRKNMRKLIATVLVLSTLSFGYNLPEQLNNSEAIKNKHIMGLFESRHPKKVVKYNEFMKMHRVFYINEIKTSTLTIVFFQDTNKVECVAVKRK